MLKAKESIENERKNIIAKNRNRQIYKFRDEVIEEFIQNNLTDKEEISTKDFEIKNNDDFIKFIMAYKLTQKNKFQFESKLIDEKRIKMDEWELPNVSYRRKRKI